MRRKLVADAKPLVVVAGVSGAGKSTVGALVAERLGVPFADADSLHPPTNVVKMAAGIPLTDDDRWPWFRLVGRALADAEATGLMIACSALRRSYRDAILAEAPTARFVVLDMSPELLAGRLAARQKHFMPASLLASQLAMLEPLAADEPGFTVALDAGPEGLADRIAVELSAFSS